MLASAVSPPCTYATNNVLQRPSIPLTLFTDAAEVAARAEAIGNFFLRRLDANRATKRGEGGPLQPASCVPPSELRGFNFTKVNADEVLFTVGSSYEGRYMVVVNKFPLARRHVLLCTADLRAQLMRRDDLRTVAAILTANPALSAYFNSWGASASVNHLHVHIVDEGLPSLRRRLRVVAPAHRPSGATRLVLDNFPAAQHFCFVYSDAAAGRRVAAAADAVAAKTPTSDHTGIEAMWRLLDAMHRAEQPYNLLFGQGLAVVVPRPVDPTKRGRNEPFTVGDHGGMEFGGRFTLYNGGDLDAMTGDLMHSALVNCSSECVAPGWGGGEEDGTPQARL